MADTTHEDATERAIETQTPIAPDWPLDQYGLMSSLRTELVRNINNVQGNKEKLDLFMAHIRASAKWAVARFGVQQAINAENLAMHEARAAIEQAYVDANAPETQESDIDKQARQLAAGVTGAVVGTV